MVYELALDTRLHIEAKTLVHDKFHPDWTYTDLPGEGIAFHHMSTLLADHSRKRKRQKQQDIEEEAAKKALFEFSIDQRCMASRALGDGKVTWSRMSWAERLAHVCRYWKASRNTTSS